MYVLDAETPAGDVVGPLAEMLLDLVLRDQPKAGRQTTPAADGERRAS
jgi:hypothetical protein